MFRNALSVVTLATLLAVCGCDGSPATPSAAEDDKAAEGPKQFGGLSVTRGELEGYYSKYLQTSFAEKTRSAQLKRTVSDEKSLIIIELVGSDRDLSEVKLTFSWDVDPETGESAANKNKKAMQCIGKLCNKIGLSPGVYADLFRSVMRKKWSSEKGIEEHMFLPGKFVQVKILPITIAQAKKFQGKGIFVSFHIRAVNTRMGK